MSRYNKLNSSYVNKVDRYHTYLLEHLESVLEGLPWAIKVVKQLRIGFDKKRGCLTFPIYDQEWNLQNLYWHKSEKFPPKLVKGAPSKLLYPLPLIVKYRKDETLNYVEGLKDAVTLLSIGLNVATHIGSASAIPDDMNLITSFERVVTIFDNDQAGRNASNKFSLRLLKDDSRMELKKVKWSDNAPEGYDVTEYFKDGNSAEDFKKLLSEAEIVDVSESQSSQSSHNYLGSQMKHSSFVPQIDELKLTKALRGFLGAVSGTTDAPHAFLMGAQLTLWAGVIGNKIYLEAGNGILRPNVWLTCFARSSMSGKSTAITTSGLPFKNIQEQLDNDYEEALRGFVFEQEMWKALDPEERDDESEPQRPTRGILLLASDFSDAGFYEMMKDNPVSGVIVAKEFADLHTKLHRKMTGQALAFLGAYDGDRMTRSTRDHGFEIIEEPTFSILGATTFASFATVFSSTEVENGYLSRIFPIVISAPTKDWMHYLRRDKSDQSYNTRMENQIRAWLDFEGDIQVRIPDDIEEFFCEWESRMRNDLALKYGERMGPSIVRMVPGALKVAMILQTLEIPDPEGIEELVLTLETIECAQMLMEDVFLPSMSYLFNNKVIVSYEELNENKILDILISSKGKADRSTLRKKSRLSSDILDKTLASMEYKGMIEKEIIHAKREQGGGNPKTVYSLCKD